MTKLRRLRTTVLIRFLFPFPLFASAELTAAKVCFVGCLLLSPLAAIAQTDYENLPVTAIEVVLDEPTQVQPVIDQFQNAVRDVLPENFSVVKNREALQALFNTGRVASARLEVIETGTAAARTVGLKFIVKRPTLVDQVMLELGDSKGDNVTESELLLRLNLITSGAVINERALQQSADAVQTYLRERGFYKAEVSYSTAVSQRPSRVNVTFKVTPNEQARVADIAINIKGFDATKVADDLELKKDKYFSRVKLNEDVARVRRELVKQDYLAADLREPFPPIYDADTNTVSISLNGNVNSKVSILIKDENDKEIEIGERKQRELLPIKREGTVDRSSIEEGRRRLVNNFQEDGYFFAAVTAACGVEPFTAEEANIFRNNTDTACDFLDGLNLEGRKISVTYQANLSRRFSLSELRIEGTNRLTIDDVKPALRSQTANALAIIPALGYGRGYTSREILDQDVSTIRSIMRELGYRSAAVSSRLGISPTGDDLIITFAVREGAVTRVSAVEITGNNAIPDQRLIDELPLLLEQPFSRVRTRNGNNRILGVYSREGYIDANSTFSIVEVPSAVPNEERVKIVYNLEREGAKTFVNRVLTIGNSDTKRASILETIALKPGDLLRADRITESERNLYQTDVFRQVTITNETAGTNADGTARRDVLIDLQEQGQRVLSYGFGLNTDDGANGFADIRYLNLFGRFYQAGARIRASRRQQQIQLDFTNPRFVPDTGGRYAPLTISAAYLRDTGVTRFFRTTLDQGANGVVQRLDEDGKPIDEFGNNTSVPSINRATFNIETSRTINRASRSLLFVRYRIEDVQILNTRSLLVAPLLTPDRNVRISGIGATFARDTRENCNNKRSLLEQIRTGETGNPCQYNAGDATRGEFLSLDYQMSANFLGANTSFNKLQATYQRYLQVDRLNKTVFAGRIILGLASIYNARDRDGNGTIDEADQTLPISERFFAGGSTNLRGFGFEEAGPRRAVAPTGQFRDRNNNLVTINPFTIPFGGNALAVVNLEARVPVTNFLAVVPFYDGGNVFRRVSEIFKPRAATPNDLNNFNLRAVFTSTVGLGFRLKTPIGGSAAIDYGFLLNPPQFLIPQLASPPTVFTVHKNQFHFRFSQAF